MIIQFASDLHLEFPENKKFLLKNPLKPIGDILLLSGDIVPFAVMDQNKDFFNYVSDHFNESYWIPGNHEYYYFDLANKCGSLHERIRDNVYLVNNKVIKVEDIAFIFTTLWSKISPTNSLQIAKHLSDFMVIKYKGRLLNPEKYNHLHEESVKFIEQSLRLDNKKRIVVSHHVPTFYNYPEKYKGDILNEAFAVELFNLISKSGPDYWIYGHTHFNSNDFRIGKTLLTTNQLGYVRYGEHESFSSNRSICL